MHVLYSLIRFYELITNLRKRDLSTIGRIPFSRKSFLEISKIIKSYVAFKLSQIQLLKYNCKTNMVKIVFSVCSYFDSQRIIYTVYQINKVHLYYFKSSIKYLLLL